MTQSCQHDGTPPLIAKALAGFLFCKDRSQKCLALALPAQLGPSLSECHVPSDPPSSQHPHLEAVLIVALVWQPRLPSLSEYLSVITACSYLCLTRQLIATQITKAVLYYSNHTG